MSVFTGEIESATIEGRTFEVFNVAIEEANAKISEAVLGQSLTTEPAASSLAAAMAIIDEIKCARDRTPFTFTCEVVIDIRDGRRLLTGRPRPKRAFTKARNQETRAQRRALVEMAGWCRHQSDAQIRTGAEIYRLCLPFAGRVSVPRSLRSLLGRYVGSGK